MKIEDISNIASESGVVASLIHNPEFIYYSEDLLPNHFCDLQNRYIYTAISMLVSQGVTTVDAYNILSVLESSEGTRRCVESLKLDELQDFIEMSESIARRSVDEYKLLVNNVLDMALRRDTYKRLRECEAMCLDTTQTDLEEKIYSVLDDVMMEYATTSEVPAFSEVIDDCWEEIEDRQGDGFAGIPFKFPALNDYVTIERGELSIFAAPAKGSKSTMLLNCAVDLLRAGHAVFYIDSELSTRLFTARLLSHITQIEFKRLTAGNYSIEERSKIAQAIDWLKTRKFTHVYVPMFNSQSIYTMVKKVMHTQGIDVLIIDYFKSSGDGTAWDSYAELGKLVDMVKNQLCGALGIAGLGAAQLNSAGKLADSAKIVRNASTIMTILDKTPEEMEADGPECGNKKLQVIANRNGMQMVSGEYIDLNLFGNTLTLTQAAQHIPQTPY